MKIRPLCVTLWCESFHTEVQVEGNLLVTILHIVSTASPDPFFVEVFGSACWGASTGAELTITTRSRHTVHNTGWGYRMCKCCFTACCREQQRMDTKVQTTVKDRLITVYLKVLDYVRVYRFCFTCCWPVSMSDFSFSTINIYTVYQSIQDGWGQANDKASHRMTWERLWKGILAQMIRQGVKGTMGDGAT